MNIFLSPHNDDETLFGAYTLIREKPLVIVITDSYIQPNRGEVGCDAETRWAETVKALEILGCTGMRLGVPDNEIINNATKIAASLQKSFGNVGKVYAPALQGGNHVHDIVNSIAHRAFGDKVVEYTTYTKTEFWTKGDTEVIPTPEELALKNLALECYTSQIKLPSTRPHFEAVKGKSEWIMKPQKEL